MTRLEWREGKGGEEAKLRESKGEGREGGGEEPEERVR